MLPNCSSLGEEFSQSGGSNQEADAASTTPPAKPTPQNDFSASSAAAKRLALARRCWRRSLSGRSICGPVLDQVNMDSITFLSALRGRMRARRSGVHHCLLVPTRPCFGRKHNFWSVILCFHALLVLRFDTEGGSNQQRQRLRPRPIFLPPFGRRSFAWPRKSCCGHSLRRIRIGHLQAEAVNTW